MSDLSYPQAVVLGLLQGVTELFPVSSLGHSILVPAWLGGDWASLVTESKSSGHTPFLAFVVALHVATALALILFYWRDWVRIVTGLIRSIRRRSVVDDNDGRLAWLLIAGTIPVGVVGLIAEKPLRVLFATPIAAAILLFLNGLVLLTTELLRRRRRRIGRHAVAREAPARSVASLSMKEGAAIGSAQILALFPGISRSGSTISAGLLRGLDHEDAAHFAFLLATPVILAAGVLKIPELFGPDGQGIGGQVVVGSVCAFVAAFAAVAFLAKYFHTRTLYPFVVYCLVAGAISIVRFA
ncbi:undecaprenyl-diphosphate phosphatase [Gordonia otitidis]|uniref:undecaprenyl-diphosphate phosphatase n=1 Tax=Gordonia otitidis TaxID=249058 RepID=UPI001D1497E4|nr:undecaprenyl-diphosphate phosphatase [Gordonia otitidis]UEA59431.1 undecaprenyl-diphosphate phosphatase [Gordonia otitidis]